jgi:hypothetical protein
MAIRLGPYVIVFTRDEMASSTICAWLNASMVMTREGCAAGDGLGLALAELDGLTLALGD